VINEDHDTKSNIMKTTVPLLSERGNYLTERGRTQYYQTATGKLLAVTSHEDEGRGPTAFLHDKNEHVENLKSIGYPEVAQTLLDEWK
jgi:hemoglobin-like flavoprotein